VPRHARKCMKRAVYLVARRYVITKCPRPAAPKRAGICAKAPLRAAYRGMSDA
jgi:hypothetical protein